MQDEMTGRETLEPEMTGPGGKLWPRESEPGPTHAELEQVKGERDSCWIGWHGCRQSSTMRGSVR